jgi:glycosyltransferase involved in cell wall biosynthesis
MNSRRRVLVIAEAANPEWVSVPLVGWKIANALREVVDVHLVTQVRNREAILRAGLTEGRDFTCIDTEAVMKPLWSLISILRGGSNRGWSVVTAFQSLFYPLFERAVWQRFGKQIKAREFDVVHRVTPLSLTAPSSLARRCSRADVPFILGPLNGGVPWPMGFEKERSEEGEKFAFLRPLYKLHPGVGATWRNASAIIVASRIAAAELPESSVHKTVFIPENAVDPEQFALPKAIPRPETLNLCFIGRLVPCKGLEMALDASQSLLRSNKANFRIIGDGPLMQSLRDQAERLGISEHVDFTGWVSHADIPSLAAQSNIFFFPSIREFGGGAVIEAMALGLVPIVIDYGGPGEIVTPETGFRLKLRSREAIVVEAAALLTEIAEGRHNLNAIATNAFERVNALYTWERKARQLAEVYAWVCGDRPDRPEFPFFEA